MLKEYSKAIYSDLINGKLINKFVYQDGLLEANPLYDEIINDLDKYTGHYEMIGFELIACGEYFYIKTADSSKYKDTPALKIQALLLIISQFCKTTGIKIEAIKSHQAGLNREKIKSIAEIVEVQDILKACDMKKDLALEVDNNLVTRGFAFWNQNGGLVLTNGGVIIFDKMFEGISFDSESLPITPV
ncbi:MAG: hypothetical protein ACJAS1_000846 [Oleiphilaceae bacterium]|jgi:hypothetical protein